MAKTVKPIPEGHHTIQPYLVVQKATEAIAFYAKAFGAETMMRMPGPDGESTMHAEIRIGDSVVYLSDENPQWQTKSAKTLGGSPISMHLYVPDVDAAFKRAVDAGAQVTMPLTDMFWGDRYGKVVDPFGIQWGLASQTEIVPPEEIARRARAWFEKMASAEGH